MVPLAAAPPQPFFTFSLLLLDDPAPLIESRDPVKVPTFQQGGFSSVLALRGKNWPHERGLDLLDM